MLLNVLDVNTENLSVGQRAESERRPILPYDNARMPAIQAPMHMNNANSIICSKFLLLP
jgi:hypothetical protein